MSQPTWNIVWHKTPSGERPGIEFLKSLSHGDRQRIRGKLAKVEREGPTYDDFSGQLTKDIWELRFPIGRLAVRLFFFYQPGYTIVITHGMCKKDQEAKPADIQKATAYMREYLEGGKHE